jgi:thiamine pyrophosphate-dependent acetolactate synthase large subunit-like protein
MTRQHLDVPPVRSEAALDRRTLVLTMLQKRTDALIVASLGAPCWDLAACGDHDLNFYVWGAMGTSCMVALGLATAQPQRRVIALVGDGDMLMGLGSLATVAAARPHNLAIMVLDNERYGDTGNQPTHTAAGVDLEGIGRAAGFAATMVLRAPHDTAEGTRLLFEAPGPALVVAKVASEKAAMVLPPRDGTYLKHRFRRALLGSQAV